MTALTGKKPKDTYRDLLQVSNANSGIDESLRPVEDGEGTPSALSLSASRVSVGGNELVLDRDGDTSISAGADDRIDIAIGGAYRLSLGPESIDVKIAGAEDFRFREDAFEVLAGSTLTVEAGAVLAMEMGAALTGVPVVPTGMVTPFAGAAAPAGWLPCDGREVSRADYAALFAVIGTAHGAGDGATTFALPDLRGRVVAGLDDMGGTAAGRLTGRPGGVDGAALGGSGGAETHALGEAETAAHSHGPGSYEGRAIGTTASGGAHTHNLTRRAGSGTDPGRSYQITENGGGGNARDATMSAGAHTHGFSADISLTGRSEEAGGGDPHNNVQPTTVLNYIVKT